MENDQIVTKKPTNRKKILIAVVIAIALVIVGAILINRYRNDRKTDAPSIINKSGIGTVKIGEDGFVPKTLYVKKGATVTWINNNPRVHRVASNPYPVKPGAELDSVTNIATGGTYSHTFNNSGTYNYHDELNPTYNATIVVE